jgi:uncharacterized protein (DUF433 family)
MNMDFPGITYRRGAAGSSYPVLRGTGIRVQTIVMAAEQRTIAEIAEDYDLTEAQVRDAQNFYEAYRVEIDAYIREEAKMEPGNAGS